jgi:PRTRC genetic system ThiF family protein
VAVILAGCGGTGSFLALHLARLAYHARELHGLRLQLLFVDPDTVESKNLGRQNFCAAEVGEPKAWALMRRYNAAFGLDAQMRHGPFDAAALEPYARDRDWFTLVAGCVDNAAARCEIHSAVADCLGRVWWLDCGNHENAGQVVIGNDTHIVKPDIAPLGFCQALPAPSVVHPELLEAPARPVPDAAGPSCAELALADVQSLMVNQAVAGWAATYLAQLLLSHDLDVYATYFDLVAGSARSLPITG